MISVALREDDERKIIIRLDTLPSRLRSRLRPAITTLTNQLLNRVRAAEPVRTGRLRQATQAFVDEHENRISGKVRILGIPGRTFAISGRFQQGSHNVSAAALEYGAHRTFLVRQHFQHLGHVFNEPTSRRLVMVEGYTRRANITARRFLRQPAAAMRARALAELQAIVKDEIR